MESKLIILLSILATVKTADEYFVGRYRKKTICTLSWYNTDAFRCVMNHDEIANCLAFRGPSGCFICAFGYSVSADQHTCEVVKDPKCYREEGGKCTVCASGFLPNEEGQCTSEKCDANCEACSATEGCLWCKDGFSGQVKDKKNVCVADSSSLSNCVSAEGNECVFCKFNFFNDKGKCNPQDKYKVDVFPQRKAHAEEI